MIGVFHVFNIMGNGGIEHFVMGRYRMIDRTKVQFDFLITSPEPIPRIRSEVSAQAV